MKATILYQSKKGRTATWARAMAMYLWRKGVHVSLSAISDYKPEQLHDTDILFLGCWTSGWFVVNQHPSKIWIEASRELPSSLPPYLVLFTTYKIRTGSIFRKMLKFLNLSGIQRMDTMSSKTAILSDEDKKKLDVYVDWIKSNKGTHTYSSSSK